MTTAIPLLLIVWLVALLMSMTFGGMIHLVPVLAAGLAAYRIAFRRKTGDATMTSGTH